MRSFIHQYRYYFLLALAVVLVYWPLSFCIYSATYDMADCWLPWRYYQSVAFHNGIFPLWNPFQQGGYPMYADLQGPLWSPENFITGNLFTVNMAVLQIIETLYLVWGSWGMFRLLKYLDVQPRTAFLYAVVFATGGFVSGHLQHFFSIVSVMFVPHTLFFFLRFLKNPGFVSVVGVSICLFITLTTGNQTFNIINLHFMLVMVLVAVISHLRKKQNRQCMRLVSWSVCLLLLTVIMGAGVLMAYADAAPYVSRFDGLTLEQAGINAFTWKSLYSVFFPFATMQDWQLTGTDISMSNIFTGSLTVILFIFILVSRPSRKEMILLATAALFFLLALGNNTFVYPLLFKADPLLRLFRFPAYFIFYAWFIVLLLAAKKTSAWIQDTSLSLRKMRVSALLGFGALLATCIILGRYADAGGWERLLQSAGNMDARKQAVDPFWAVWIELPVITACFGLTCYFLLKRNMRGLVISAIAEIFLITQFTLLYTGVSSFKTSATDQYLANMPHTYGNYDLYKTREENRPDNLWRNNGVYDQSPRLDFFNSFYLSSFVRFDTLQQKPGTFDSFLTLSCDYGYSSLRITPNTISARLITSGETDITLRQCYFPGWKLSDNGKPVPMHASAGDPFIHAIIAPGKHNLQWSFERPMAFLWFLVSYLLSCAGIVWLILKGSFERNLKRILAGATLLLYFSAVLLFYC